MTGLSPLEQAQQELARRRQAEATASATAAPNAAAAAAAANAPPMTGTEAAAAELARRRQAEKPMSLRDRLTGLRQSVLTAGRNAVEGIAGTLGDLPGAVGGVTGYGLDLLPDALVSPETAKKVGENVTDFTHDALKAKIRGTTGATKIEAPTTQEVHETVSKHLPAAVEAETAHQPKDRVESGVQTVTEFGLNMLSPGGAKRNVEKLAERSRFGKVRSLGEKFARRTVLPAAFTEGADALTDELVKNGTIRPQDATAIKVLAGGLGGAAGGWTEKRAAMRQASKQLSTSPAALKALHKGLIDSGLTPEQGYSKMLDLGIDNATLMDLGPGFLQLGMKISTKPGTGRTAVIDRLSEREQGAGERAQGARRDAFGPDVDKPATLQVLEDRAERIGQQYPAAKKNQTRPAALQGIADELDTELATARGSIRGPLARVKRSLNIPGTEDLEPSAEGLHAVRQSIDQEIAKAEPGSPVYGKLTRYRKMVDAELKAIAPDIKSLDQQFSATRKEGEAFETGENTLKKSGQVSSPGEFKNVWDQMTPEERQMATAGASRFVEQQLGLTDRERQKLKTVLGGDWNEAKMRTMLGDEKTDAFMQHMMNEDTFRNTYGKVVQNSRTPEALDQGEPGIFSGAGEAAATGAAGGTVGGGVVGGVTGATSGASMQVLRNLFASKGMPEKLRNQIGPLLANGRPDDVFRALQMAQEASKASILPQAVVAALLARQSDLGDR